MNYKFSENEVPFGILQRYGLTQEMVEDLPLDVLQNIYDGKRSPVLPVQMTADDGEIVKDRTRFSLVRKNDGTVDVIFYPIREEIDLKNLNDAQRQRLEANKPIIGYRHEGETEAERGPKCFIQLDPENMQVLSVTTPVIGRNLQYVMDDLHLTGAEIQKIQNGVVLTIDLNDELVSVGIDLNSKTGIRYAAGDEQVWNRESKREWDKYTFGAFGCWVMDDNGNLDYVSEEDYTEELWNEQKKQGMRMQHQR